MRPQRFRDSYQMNERESIFSLLKRVKSFMKSSMNYDRLNVLLLFTIESDVVSKLSFKETIN